MAEAYLGSNTYCDVFGQSLGLEGRVVKQVKSDLYEQINPFRYELSTGVFIQQRVKLAVKYVSPFLQQDHVRQILADLSIYFSTK